MDEQLGTKEREKTTNTMKLKYAKEAVEDLIRLRKFISEKNPDSAARISQKLIEGITRVMRFPELGIRVEQAPDPEILRDIILGDYVVRYLILKESIYILKVWHHRENRKPKIEVENDSTK